MYRSLTATSQDLEDNRTLTPAIGEANALHGMVLSPARTSLLPFPVVSRMPGDRPGANLLRFELGACMRGASASGSLVFCIRRNLGSSRTREAHFASEGNTAGRRMPDPRSHCLRRECRKARPHTYRPGPSPLRAGVVSVQRSRPHPTKQRLRHLRVVNHSKVRRTVAEEA